MEKRTGNKRNAHARLLALCYQLSEKHDDEDGISSNKEDNKITGQELLATIMNQMREGAREGESDEGNTIHMIEEDFSVYMMENDENQFLGACLDIGASVSLIGRQQAEEYCNKTGIPLLVEIKPKKTLVWFPN